MDVIRLRMRVLLLLILLAIARAAGATCLDDCMIDFGGAGPDYGECVADCGVCGNGEIEGDEECDDGNTVGGDCCDSSCQPEPAGSPCVAEDDDDLCDTATCDGDGECDAEEVPAPDCRVPEQAGGATLIMRDAENDANDVLLWKWRRGAATSKAEFGDPPGATDYALCVYDDTGLLTSVTVPAGGSCGRRGCWMERGSGFRYRNPDGTPDGAAGVLLRPGRRDGRTKVVFAAAGENLELPDLASLASPLTVQLRRSGSGVCWSATYTFPPARRNDDTIFRDRSDAAPPAVVSTTTTTTSTAPDATSSTTTIVPGGSTTTTLAGARVDVTVVDGGGNPVADADVTVSYADGSGDDDFTDDAGVVSFAGQPVGVAATVTAEDDEGRSGSVSSPGFVTGSNPVTVPVR